MRKYPISRPGPKPYRVKASLTVEEFQKLGKAVIKMQTIVPNDDWNRSKFIVTAIRMLSNNVLSGKIIH